MSFNVPRAESTVSLERTYGSGSSAGTSVTFLAIVKFPGGLTTPPTGTVQFLDNGEKLGAPVSISLNGAATLTTVLPVTGRSHTITAIYNGDANYQPATSNSITQLP